MLRNSISEWVEYIPSEKIVCGTDAGFREIIDKCAGIICIKEILSSVLDDKIRAGYFSHDHASVIAENILYNNARKLYEIK